MPSNDSNDRMPGNIRSGTLTVISKSKAVLFGRLGNSRLTDGWLLNLENAKQLKDSSSIWTKLPGGYTTSGYNTVLEPVRKGLWIIGGSKPTPGHRGPQLFGPLFKASLTSEVLIMPLNPTLKDLTIATVARTTCPYDPRLAPGQLPTQFKNEIDDYRAEIGGQYLCSPGERCSSCRPNNEQEPPRKRVRKS